MEISIDYSDGRVREFNTHDYVSASQRLTIPDEPSATNFVTELDLRLDNLKEKGLRLDIYLNVFGWSQGQRVDLTEEMGPYPNGAKRMVPVAARYLYGTVPIISAEELEGASYILVRRCGEAVPVAWRQGSGQWLVDGMAFARTARQIYTDPRVTSTNSQAVVMMRYLTRAFPDLDTRDLVEMTGFAYQAYLEAKAQEDLNGKVSFPTDEAGEDGGEPPDEGRGEPDAPVENPGDPSEEEVDDDLIVDGDWDDEDDYDEDDWVGD